MAKIIGVSGAHGTGKTTVLNAIEQMEIGNVTVDAFSVARHVQEEYKVPLSEIVADPAAVPTFQDKIVQTMVERAGSLRKWYKTQDAFMFVDRSPVDTYAYAKIWLQGKQGYADWLTQYETKCAQALRAYDLIILVPPREFEFVAESKRASKETQMAHHTECVEFLNTHGINVHTVESLDVGARCNEFLKAAGWKNPNEQD